MKSEYKKQVVRFLSIAVEYGACLYIFFWLFDKGEGLRNIGLYGAFTAWLILVFFKEIKVSFHAVSLAFFLFIFSCILSSLFSIDVESSFMALKSDVLKPVMIFLVISTFFDLRMLMRLGKVICFFGIIILAMGLEGFLSGRTDFYYTSANIFLNADKNKFGFFAGLIFPFFLLFFASSEKVRTKASWGFTVIWGIVAAFFSASRSAMGNILAVIGCWAVFFSKREHRRKLAIPMLALLIILSLSFPILPSPLRNSILSVPQHLTTFTYRIDYFWFPAFEAIQKRPVIGWGYGNNIYRDPRPFENGKKPNWKLTGGLHSTFIKILFHQGIVGLASYLLLLILSLVHLFRIIRDKTDERRLLAATLFSIILGSFIVNSFLLSIPLERLAPIAGMSAALVERKTL